MAASVNGAAELAVMLTAGAAEVEALIAVAVDGSAATLKAETQANISGRPGPEFQSGDYRGSWSIVPLADDATEVSASVGSDAVQAHRLEWGFVGEDSTGRQVDAPPYPHHGPAVQAVEPVFEAAMEAVVDRAVPW